MQAMEAKERVATKTRMETRQIIESTRLRTPILSRDN